LVDPGFSKRNDAKAAVCLQAMSQGIGKYIESIGKEFENKVTPHMRQQASQIFTVLAAECAKVQAGRYPQYQYETEKDGKKCESVYDVYLIPHF
jgi:hypothetical protein